MAPHHSLGAPEQPRVEDAAPAEPAFLQAIATLRLKYARALPHKLGELAHALYRSKDLPGNPERVAEARTRAHRLRGTASAFGFPAIGMAAGHIERLLVGAPPVDAQTWVEIENELAAAVASIEGVASPPSPPGPGERPQVATTRVLVVDGDTAFLSGLAELGRQRLIEVVPASSAPEALQLAGQVRFEAAILDELLPPSGSALRLAMALRGLPGLESLPLAFLSQEAQTMDNRVAAAHAGAMLHLCKPLDADSFSAAVHQLAAVRSVPQPHVLLVDDDPDFLEQVSAMLRAERLRVTSLCDPHQVLQVLEQTPVDLVLLDGQMPQLSGLDVCRGLRVTPRWQELPILFLTSEAAPEARSAAFLAGADDYLLKPVVREELLARIRVRLERQQLMRDRADRDGLTGLLLRRAFIHTFNARLLEAQRHGWPLAVCLLDLDHFKQVNDEHGHLAGDRVLASLGGLLERRFRAGDLRGRWGGEEFVLAFPGEGTESAQLMVARVLEELQGLQFTGDGGESFRVSFSAGIAVYADDGNTVDALLRAADRRLYQAKDGGRRQVVGAGLPSAPISGLRPRPG